MIYILRGIAASGKSTWAKNYAAKHENTVIISRDAIRLELFGSAVEVKDYWSNLQPQDRTQIENQITLIERTRILKALALNKDVIVDNTHLKLSYTVIPVRAALDYNVPFILKTFQISPEEAIKRDSQREMSVGAEVINEQYKWLQRCLSWGTSEMLSRASKKSATTWIYPDFEVSKNLLCVPANNRNPLAKCAIITDIDGNIAERKLKKKTRSYYEPLSEEYLEDLPRKDLIKVINQLVYSGLTNIILTGRYERYRRVTEQWLKENNVDYHLLLMRPDNDSRPDHMIKYEMLKSLGDKYSIILVTDDRPKVTQMYNEVGLTTLNSRKDINVVF